MSSASKPWNFYALGTEFADFHLGTALLYAKEMHAALGNSSAGKEFGWEPACTDILRNEFKNGQLSKMRIDPYYFNKFTVVINACKRLDSLIELVIFYNSMDAVHRIVVVWNPCGHTVPAVLKSMVRVIIKYEKVDNINARFPIDPLIKTEAVLICDDDIFVKSPDVLGVWHAWMKHKKQIVGLYQRDVVYDSVHKRWLYKVLGRQSSDPYSIILTKFMFVRREYLTMYRCLMPRSLLDYIQRNTNCEDIAFSMMVSGLTGLPPLRYRAKFPVVDRGHASAHHSDNRVSIHLRTLKASVTAHLTKRDQCANKFKENYFLYSQGKFRHKLYISS
jgi:alpha-1,4-N-acetylglucosaminyltransferase EXTL3